jgi:hypothetical protein
LPPPLPHRNQQIPLLPYKPYDAPQRAPFTLDITPSDEQDDEPKETVAPSKPTGRGQPRKVRNNSLKPYLQGYNSPGHALYNLPQFDDIVTGTLKTDLGKNARPLSKKVVISLLQRLDVISTVAVQEYMHLTLRSCTERHAQKIAQCLRVIERGAKTLAETKWPPPGSVGDQFTFSSTNYITPCGSDTCAVCAGSPEESWDLTQHGTCVSGDESLHDAETEQAED